jgi:hypothetical protein
MHSEDIAVMASICAISGAVIAVGTTYIQRRFETRKQRLEVLDKALDRADLDPATRQELLRSLTDEQKGDRPFFLQPGFWQRTAFAVGWMAFLLCGGLLVLGYTGIIYMPNLEFVAPMALIGLGLMSLPVALRDFGRRSLADQRP